MHKIRLLTYKALVSVLLILLAGSAPGFVLPQTAMAATDTSAGSAPPPPASTASSDNAPTPSSPAPTPPPTKNTTGPRKPTGADSNTYHYNSATGMWENDYYIWNPTTGQTQPKTPQTYSYNPATGRWDTTEWVYDAASGAYKPNTVSVDQPPAGAPTTGSAAVTTPTTAIAATVEPTTNSTTGPSSNNSSSDNNQSGGTFDLFYNASISNGITSTATSGDASVTNNTLGGNATSGNATVIATIANLLQSSANVVDPNSTVVFTSDIQGNVTGDFLIDPAALAKQLKSSSQTSTTPPDKLTVTANGDGQINNDVNLSAASGNATVAGNTTGGNATGGNANAVANLVNLLNSTIGAGKSFIGTVNIYGNLNGDILLPPGMLSALLASNNSAIATPAGATATSTAVNASNTQTINNQITTSATSGQATVSHNTTGGNATSGNALSNITILNLTGSNVIGSNDMLVFVNVLGKWVGAIVHAPAGATAAEIGSGITTNTSVPLPADTAITTTNNDQINNNITLAATSGDATVSNNTTGGNATSGNATTSANLLNVVNSNLSLSNWFGILFINVFGTWYGSFGVNTSAGNPAAPATKGASSASAKPAAPAQVFRFVPAATSTSTPAFGLASLASNGSSPSTPSSSSSSPTHPSAILGSHITTPPTSTQATFSINYWLPVIGLAIGASLFITERALSRREQEQDSISTL